MHFLSLIMIFIYGPINTTHAANTDEIYNELNRIEEYLEVLSLGRRDASRVLGHLSSAVNILQEIYNSRHWLENVSCTNFEGNYVPSYSNSNGMMVRMIDIPFRSRGSCEDAIRRPINLAQSGLKYSCGETTSGETYILSIGPKAYEMGVVQGYHFDSLSSCRGALNGAQRVENPSDEVQGFVRLCLKNSPPQWRPGEYSVYTLDHNAQTLIQRAISPGRGGPVSLSHSTLAKCYGEKNGIRGNVVVL